VILKANNEKVNSVEDFRKVLESASGSVRVEGIYPGYEGVYNFILNLDSAK
jgi:serine protease Do